MVYKLQPAVAALGNIGKNYSDRHAITEMWSVEANRSGGE